MSIPAEVNAQNLSGQWSLNKTLSDSSEPMLSLQGVTWITRKTLSKAPISLSISQYVDDKGLHHFDYEQKTLGRCVQQNAVLNGEVEEVSHPLFGEIKVTQNLSKVGSIDEPYLTEALEEGTEDVVELKIVNDDAGWVSRQVLGVEYLDGQRRHTRRAVVTKDEEVVRARLVYDWENAS